MLGLLTLAAAANAAVPAVPAVQLGKDASGSPVRMPLAGLGTGGYWAGNDSAVYAGVRQALTLGYRHLDTALGYRTQASLAKAVADSGVPRAELFILSKIPGGLDGQGAAAAIDQSLSQLGTHADVMLLHFPGTWGGDGGKASRQASWLALEVAYRAGRVRAIGVSHYCPRHIEDILEVSTVNISVNQVEYHVGMKNSPLNLTDDPGYDRQHGVFYESFMPLCGQCDDTALITGNVTGAIGRVHGKTGAQVALRWLIQSGTAVIPRAGNKAYQADNLDIFDFELSKAEMDTLDAYTKPNLAGGGGDCSVA